MRRPAYVRTQYKLDLPKADPALIERALFLMRETASEVSFNPGAVDRERGVVIAEMRDRENFGLPAQPGGERTALSRQLFFHPLSHRQAGGAADRHRRKR
jgi:zinc protease